MIRIYSSILMSSLLLSSTAVNAQSLETRSSSRASLTTFLFQDKSVTELLTPEAENPTFYADSDKETLPERGSGR